MKTFAEFQESVASIALKGGSKLIPVLMTGIGTVGTIMQAKRKYSGKGDEKMKEIARQQGLDLTDPRQRMKAMSRSRTKAMKGKVNNPEGVYKRIKKKKDDIPEEAMAPTNNVGDGKIAGTFEAGDDPPVKKKKKKGKKKRYIYGGRGSRKMWMK